MLICAKQAINYYYYYYYYYYFFYLHIYLLIYLFTFWMIKRKQNKTGNSALLNVSRTSPFLVKRPTLTDFNIIAF